LAEMDSKNTVGVAHPFLNAIETLSVKISHLLISHYSQGFRCQSFISEERIAWSCQNGR